MLLTLRNYLVFFFFSSWAAHYDRGVLKYWLWFGDQNKVDPKYYQFAFLSNSQQRSCHELWAKIILKNDSVKPLELLKNFCMPDTSSTGRTSISERDSWIWRKKLHRCFFSSRSLSYLNCSRWSFSLDVSTSWFPLSFLLYVRTGFVLLSRGCLLIIHKWWLLIHIQRYIYWEIAKWCRYHPGFGWFCLVYEVAP